MDEKHRTIHFGGFSLDPANERLQRGSIVIDVRPKSMALLVYLAMRPGRLLTKDELLAAVWPDTTVTEWVLTTCIRELRAALDDDSRQPRIIETAHRRGYRFIAEVQTTAPEATTGSRATSIASSPGVVGRETELAALHGWVNDTLARDRQIGFIAGEAGIGKTTLVDEFTRGLAVRGSGVTAEDNNPLTPNPLTPCLIARGQCVEQHGEGEPYLPVLDALARLCASTGTVLPLLRRHAPAWLIQLPGLIDEEEAAALDRRLGPGSRQRMLREMAAFTEALPQPLLLILEDLHWSDHATVELLSALAQRRDPARLLLIGTYRPVEIAVREHPLKMIHHELRAHGRCRDLWLQPLTQSAVAEYLQRRWPGLENIETVARTVHHRTDGNPLFLVNVVNALAADGVIVQTDERWIVQGDATAVGAGVPAGLRQMIAAQIERLPESERSLLTLGSIAGRRFSAALIAAALDRDVLVVEEQLSRLAQRGQIVRSLGESRWPDATVAGLYELTHALYQAVLRDSVPPAVRRGHHGRIAERLEGAYAQRPADVAAELAYHFEAGGQPDRALPYIKEAAERAVRLGAGREAVILLQHGIALLDSLPTTPERTQHVIQLCISLGRALPSAQGYVRPEVEAAYERARVLSEEIGDRLSLILSLSGLATTRIARAQFDGAAEAIAGVAKLTEMMPFPLLQFATHTLSGLLRYHTGPLSDARMHLEAAAAMTDVPTTSFSIDPHVVALAYLGVTLLHLGYPDQARARLAQAAERATGGGRLFERANFLELECVASILLRDHETLAKLANEARALGTDQDHETSGAVGRVGDGLCIVAGGDVERGLEVIRSGVDGYRSGGHRVALPFLLGTYASALAASGDLDAALQSLAEARSLIEASGEQRVEADLHRLEGVIRWQCGETAIGEKCIRHAIELAREQGARWLELRATASLARLTLGEEQSPVRRRAARTALARVLESFSEGGDTADVQEARELLKALS